ncbi:MAG: 30S ribosomal protein S6 [Chloroflexi bacterium]|nr:30S ribosomal protein S6 [Chloroflexota bacterium]
MREYELTVVFSPEISDEDMADEIEKVNRLVTEKGGVLNGEVQRWGKKRLAYPIRRFKEGNYVLTRFKISPGQTAELERNLHSLEVILRHLLVKLEE